MPNAGLDPYDCDCGWLAKAADDPVVPIGFDPSTNEYYIELRKSATRAKRLPLRFCPSCGGDAPVVKRAQLPDHQIPDDGRYFSLTVLGVPVWLHWTFPFVGVGIGVCVAASFLATSLALSLAVFFWTTICVFALVLVHELGHAIAARVLHLELTAVVVAHIGGKCFVAKQPSPGEDLVFSAAGVLAQFVLLAGTLVALWIFGAPTLLPLKCAVIVFTGGNVFLVITNLWPRKDNDGARIVGALRALSSGAT